MLSFYTCQQVPPKTKYIKNVYVHNKLKEIQRNDKQKAEQCLHLEEGKDATVDIQGIVLDPS